MLRIPCYGTLPERDSRQGWNSCGGQVIPPAPVLPCQPHQRLHFRGDPWAAGIGTTAGTIELLHHKSSIPGENSIRPGNARDLVPGSAAEAFGDFGECGTLGIGQPKPGGEARPEDAILG